MRARETRPGAPTWQLVVLSGTVAAKLADVAGFRGWRAAVFTVVVTLPLATLAELADPHLSAALARLRALVRRPRRAVQHPQSAPQPRSPAWSRPGRAYGGAVSLGTVFAAVLVAAFVVGPKVVAVLLGGSPVVPGLVVAACVIAVVARRGLAEALPIVAITVLCAGGVTALAYALRTADAAWWG